MRKEEPPTEPLAFVIKERWGPSSYDVPTIRREFCALLKELGYTDVGLLEIRTPNHTHLMANAHGEKDAPWHQDAGGKAAYIIIWSTEYATEVQDILTKKKMPPFEPSSVIYIDNVRAKHRIPPKSRKSESRWFARMIPDTNVGYGFGTPRC